jgi:hypothetical protein
MTILAGTLLRRRSQAGGDCWEVVACRECRAFPDCSLPQANTARTAGQP